MLFMNQFTIVHLFLVPPHLNFHDIDMTFLTGMLHTLPRSISGDAEMQLWEKLQYLKQIKYGKDSELLPSLVVKLRLRSTLEFQKVQRHLDALSRMALDTKADFNSAIHAVTLQLKLPKHVNSDVMCITRLLVTCLKTTNSISQRWSVIWNVLTCCLAHTL